MHLSVCLCLCGYFYERTQVLPVRNDTALSLPCFADYDVGETNFQLDVIEIIFSVERKSSFLTLASLTKTILIQDPLTSFFQCFQPHLIVMETVHHN